MKNLSFDEASKTSCYLAGHVISELSHLVGETSTLVRVPLGQLMLLNLSALHLLLVSVRYGALGLQHLQFDIRNLLHFTLIEHKEMRCKRVHRVVSRILVLEHLRIRLLGQAESVPKQLLEGLWHLICMVHERKLEPLSDGHASLSEHLGVVGR